MEILLDSKAYFSDVPRSAQQQIINTLTLKNPHFEKMQRLGKYTGNTPARFEYFNQSGACLEIPRGFALSAYWICERIIGRQEINIDDRRLSLPETDLTFTGSLREFQEEAVKSMVKDSCGICVFPTGGGKTVAMLSLIARRHQPALVIVDKLELLLQWKDRACQFLDINPDEVGLIGAGKFSIGERLTIGTIQSVGKNIDSLKNKFGLVLVDECHKAAASNFGKVVSAFPAKYRYGCTATPIRSDGQRRAIFFLLGDIRYSIAKSQLLSDGHLCNAVYRQVETGFSSLLDGSTQYVQLISELVTDENRNQVICQTIADNKTEGLSLILTGRVDHCQILKEMLEVNQGIESVVLTGSTPWKEREAIFQRLNDGKIRYLISTTALLKEGFDLPELQNLFLTFPVKWKGSLIQMVGRILRPADGKEYAQITDFTDNNVGVLKHSARIRAEVYQQERIQRVE